MERPGSSLRLLYAALLLGAALLPGTVAVALATPPASGLSVSASATPSYGAAPLLVQFASSVSMGVPTSYHWNFGDGTYLNGSTTAASHPTHLYELPQQYSVLVTIDEGTSQGSASITVHVTAAPLAVAVSAEPSSGAVPLTVTFVGNVTGGTGTYVTFNWTFGDGASGSGSSVQYTYPRPGRFYASLLVRDSNGSQAVAGSWVNVTAVTSPATPARSSVSDLEWALIGFGSGIALALLVFPVRSWLLVRRDRDLASSSPVPDPPPPPMVDEIAFVPVEAASPASGPPAASDALRTSQRILLHLSAQGVLGPYDVAPPGITQAGIGAALGVRQNALTNVLRRLIDAGLLETELRHVQDQPRRLKVYRLTPRGETLGRELRRRRPPRASG